MAGMKIEENHIESNEIDENCGGETQNGQKIKETEDIKIDEVEIGTIEKNNEIEIVEEFNENEINWLEKLFPSKKNPRRDNFLNNEDVVPKEISELRIIWFQISLASLGLLIFFTQVGLLFDKFHESHPEVFQPKISKKDQFERGFPILHLALINIKGELKDFSLNQEKSPSNGILLKLPHSHLGILGGYQGYSDPKGILYIFDQRLIHKVTKYHKSFNHQTIGGSSIHSPIHVPFHNWNYADYYGLGIDIGSTFWMCGKSNLFSYSSGDCKFII